MPSNSARNADVAFQLVPIKTFGHIPRHERAERHRQPKIMHPRRHRTMTTAKAGEDEQFRSAIRRPAGTGAEQQSPAQSPSHHPRDDRVQRKRQAVGARVRIDLRQGTRRS